MPGKVPFNPPATLSAPLKDTDLISAWAKSDVQTIAALQLMRGSDNLFAPRESVTREMAVVVAMRAHAYKQDGQNSAK
ncbi:S-layer homology domain-containing protein [Paenibacillus rhizovicinus]|uniref:S-layer homology domain-containing protein n=1 Tax=Paenibacillus rhizovicinus TaxID=2704463 RepID=A0A6C0NZC4_9BACL|nr:S-layer homology domain-containing protein [Paenibacillus rhizovicinus]QHW29822.1 S-layer homology domain-containing protein [Paenibacillus rhizovicinus]